MSSDDRSLFDVLYSDSFDQRCGVGILRLREGLDCSSTKLDVVGGIQIATSMIMICIENSSR